MISFWHAITKYFALCTTVLLVSSCSSGGSDNGDGNCDMIANSNGPAYFKVYNNLDSGLDWSFQNSYAFGAEMKPGECTNMGVDARQYTIELLQCEIEDDGCISWFGPTRTVVFSVTEGETYTLTVDSSFFQ